MGHPRWGSASSVVRFGDGEGEGGFGGVDGDVVAVADGAVEDFDGEGVLDEALDGALEGAGSVGAVVAGFEDELARGGGEGEGDLAVGEHTGELGEAEVDDAGELLFAERMEDDDVVDAVEELGAEVLAQDGEDALGGLGESFFALGPGGGELRGAEVRGHDEDGVFEIDGAALGVGEAAVVEDLQEDVEDVGVGLLDLVEEDDGVGPAADGLGELAALVVADVAGRRSDEAGDGVLLHVLGHVDADHGGFVVEEELGEGAGGLGFADAGGAEEDEAADGTLGVGEAGAAAADGVGDDGERGVLADDALAQAVLHGDELLHLAFEHLGDGDAGPLGDDGGDVFLVHLFLEHSVRAFPRSQRRDLRHPLR